MFPLAPRAVSGHGYEVVGEDGQRWIDLNNNFTALIHGHSHPAVVAATQCAVRDGASFGMSTRFEIELAELLIERIPSAAQVRFTNSGTEAVMTALRVARAVTGRDKIVFLSPSYHGSADHALVALGPASTRGVSAGVHAEVRTVPPGDLEAMRAVVTGDPDVAAVVLDLVPARAGSRPLDREYVAEVRRITREHGVLLVVDEVVTLRHGFGGMAADHFEIDPDLTAVGKIIGGGLPVGALLGSAEAMEVLDPRTQPPVFHGGTFSGNPVTMRAGLEAMRLYTRSEVQRLARLGDRLRSALVDTARPLGWDVTGFGSGVRLVPAAGMVEPDGWRPRFWRAAEERGVLIVPGQLSMSLSTPMDEALIDDVAQRLIGCLEQVGPAEVDA